jgi:hypothetical protein
MRINWMLVIFVLTLASFASAPLFAQDQEQTNPPQQGGAARPQMRGPAPPVPGPPHDPHDLAGIWDGRRGYGGATFRGPAPQLTEWGQQQLKLAKPSNNGAYSPRRRTIQSSPLACLRELPASTSSRFRCR